MAVIQVPAGQGGGTMDVQVPTNSVERLTLGGARGINKVVKGARKKWRYLAVAGVTAAFAAGIASEMAEDNLDYAGRALGPVADEAGQTIGQVMPETRIGSWTLFEDGAGGTEAAPTRPGDAPITPAEAAQAEVAAPVAPAAPAEVAPAPNAGYAAVVGSVVIVASPGVPSTPNQTVNECAGYDVPGTADVPGNATSDIWAGLVGKNPGLADGLQPGETVIC